MSWLVTVFMSGVLFSIGWRFGETVYEYIKEFVLGYQEGSRKIREYKRRRENQRYITTRSRRKES